MVIDFHAHVYPKKIAEAASKSIGSFYNIGMNFPGDVDTLLGRMDSGGIDKAVIHSAALVPSRVGTINHFIAGEASKHPDRFIGFATLHPDMTDEEASSAFEEALALGLKGVKIHNDMIRIAIDDPRMNKVYDLCQDTCPLLLHMGDNRYRYDTPPQMIPVLRNFPRLRVICAHLGGYTQWDEACEYLRNENILLDCSSSFFVLKERFGDVIRFFGADRVMFGSDFPMWDPAAELKAVLSLGLKNDELEKILHQNAEDLLNSF